MSDDKKDDKKEDKHDLTLLEDISEFLHELNPDVDSKLEHGSKEDLKPKEAPERELPKEEFKEFKVSIPNNDSEEEVDNSEEDDSAPDSDFSSPEENETEEASFEEDDSAPDSDFSSPEENETEEASFEGAESEEDDSAPDSDFSSPEENETEEASFEGAESEEDDSAPDSDFSSPEENETEEASFEGAESEEDDSAPDSDFSSPEENETEEASFEGAESEEVAPEEEQNWEDNKNSWEQEEVQDQESEEEEVQFQGPEKQKEIKQTPPKKKEIKEKRTKERIPPESYDDINSFGEELFHGTSISGGNPPFTIILKDITYKEDAKDIMSVLKEHGIINSGNEDDYNTSINLGSVLIPQISEYTAIFLIHKLRRFDIDISAGLSKEINPSTSYENTEKGLLSKSSITQNKKEFLDLTKKDIESIFLSTSNELEGHKINRYISIINCNKKISISKGNEDLILEDHSFSIGNIFKETNETNQEEPSENQLEDDFQKLSEDLKIRALKIGANAVIGISYQFVPLTSNEKKDNSNYQLICSGSAVWVSRSDQNEQNPS